MAFHIIFLSFILSFVSFAKPDVSVRVVKTLHPTEPYAAQIFHGGHLWIGRYAGPQPNDPMKSKQVVEVYSKDGSTLMDAIEVPHTPTQLSGFGPASVLVVGKRANPYWKTYFTVLSLVSGKLKAQSHTFEEEVQVHRFGGNPEAMYFSDPGVNGVLNLHPQRKDVHYLQPKFSFPEKLLLTGKYLFVVERGAIGIEDDRLTRVTLEGEIPEHTFPSYRKDLGEVLLLQGEKELAVTEVSTDTILFVDVARNRETHSFPVAGGPRGLAQMGRCLIVAPENAKTLNFFDLRNTEHPLLTAWDYSAVGDAFERAWSASVDESSGRVFLRSQAKTSGGALGTHNSAIVVEDLSGETNKICNGK